MMQDSTADRDEYSIADVTVNICTVDRHDQFLACLDSLIATTPAGASLSVVFNGTPEATIAAAQERILRWQGPTRQEALPTTVPATESHNLALSMTTTRLVNFMGDDDLVLAPRLPKMIDAFNSLSVEPLVVTTFARRIAGDPLNPRLGSNKDLGPTTIEQWQDWRDSGRMFEMLWPGALMSTDAIRSLGGFESDFDRTFDNRIFTRLSAIGPVLSLPERNFGYRIHEGSVSTSNFLLQSQQVRHVQACRTAEVSGVEPPTREEFIRSERDAPFTTRALTRLRSESRMRFRRGSTLLLEGGHPFAAIRNLACSALLNPAAFIEKILDQGQPWRVIRR